MLLESICTVAVDVVGAAVAVLFVNAGADVAAPVAAVAYRLIVLLCCRI